MASPDSLSRASPDPPAVDLYNCIEQCWWALERQRISFRHERTAFAEQRKLWGYEKGIMAARIAELERQVSMMSQDGTRTPRSKELQQHMPKRRSQSAPVWEGSKPAAPPTRVFPKENDYVVSRPSAQYNRESLSSFDRTLCPSQYLQQVEPTGIPIELVDNTLDGITLKSTALPPALVAKLAPRLKSAGTSPDRQSKVKNGSDQPSQELNSPQHPQFQNRVNNDRSPERPITDLPVVNGDGAECELTAITSLSSDETSSSQELGNLNDEVQLAPQHTLEKTKEADDHLPQIDEDPALQGPLSLRNDPSLDREFLNELDLKLKKEAQRPRLGSKSSILSEIDDELEMDIELRFRKDTTNFGTAFGCLGVRDIAR